MKSDHHSQGELLLSRRSRVLPAAVGPRPLRTRPANSPLLAQTATQALSSVAAAVLRNANTFYPMSCAMTKAGAAYDVGQWMRDEALSFAEHGAEASQRRDLPVPCFPSFQTWKDVSARSKTIFPPFRGFDR